MVNYRSLIIKIIFAVFFFTIGYLIHFLMVEYTCPEFLPVPDLPSPYDKYEIHNLDDEWLHRNYHIQKFYNAWETKESYGVCYQGWGIDTPASIFWITDKGKATLILVDHLSLRKHGKKLYKIKEVDKIAIYYKEFDDENGDGKSGEFIKIVPEGFKHFDLTIRPDENSSSTVIQ